MVYLLVFEGDLGDGKNPEIHICQMLASRLSEALPIPVLLEWAETLWEIGLKQELIAKLTTGGDSPAGFWVQLNETIWAGLISRLMKEGKIVISVRE